MSSFGPIASVPQAGSERPSETFAGEHLVSAKVSRVIGPFRASAVGQYDAHLKARVIGKVSAQIHFRQLEAYAQVPRIIGPVRAMAGRKLQARARVGRIVGSVRSVSFNRVDEWTLQGFPLPLVESYQYSANDSLVRTQMAYGNWRQRRRWTGGYRLATVSFEVTRDELILVEDFLETKWSGWFTMPLVTADNGESSGGRAELHLVRLRDKLEVSGMYGDMIRVTLPLDVYSNIICETGY